MSLIETREKILKRTDYKGVSQLKYLYAEHTYGWGAEQLSYYISFLGGARALFLLFVLPCQSPLPPVFWVSLICRRNSDVFYPKTSNAEWKEVVKDGIGDVARANR